MFFIWFCIFFCPSYIIYLQYRTALCFFLQPKHTVLKPTQQYPTSAKPQINLYIFSSHITHALQRLTNYCAYSQLGLAHPKNDAHQPISKHTQIASTNTLFGCHFPLKSSRGVLLASIVCLNSTRSQPAMSHFTLRLRALANYIYIYITSTFCRFSFVPIVTRRICNARSEKYARAYF